MPYHVSTSSNSSSSSTKLCFKPLLYLTQVVCQHLPPIICKGHPRDAVRANGAAAASGCGGCWREVAYTLHAYKRNSQINAVVCFCKGEAVDNNQRSARLLKVQNSAGWLTKT
jgi:NAD(P)H-nitrite reductase large subunit